MKFVRYSLIAGLLSLAGVAQAAPECEVSVDSNDKMQFDTDRIEVPSSCDSFTVNLTHSGSLAENVMGHNWVLSLTEDMQSVAQAGASAGLDNEHVKPGDERVLAYTDVIGGGESTSVTFDVGELDPGSDYSFFCSFPGHYAMMKGSLVIK